MWPAEGTIASIAKRPGDAVAVDDVLFQIETDKVTIDVRAPEAGVMEDVMVGLFLACFDLAHAVMNVPHAHHVHTVQVKEDDTVTVGQVIAKIADDKASPSTEPPPSQPEQPEAAPACEPGRVPSLRRCTLERAALCLQRPSMGGMHAAGNAASEAEAPAGTAEPAHRQPSIRFPPRRTSDGRQISALPADEQQKCVAPASHT